MKSYNGFTPAQRNKAQAWLNSQWKAGTLPRPVCCVACGQTNGVIHAHAEDYSEPFSGGKTDQYHLCFTCHMMVHCRFKHPFSWQRYKRAIRAGMTYKGLKVWPQFVASFLEESWPEAESCGPVRGPTVLDEIA